MSEPLKFSDQQIVEMMRQRKPPFLGVLGGELVEANQESSSATLTFLATSEFCHSGNVVQGGFLTGMLDAAMSHAAIIGSGMTKTPPTLELKISFMAPGNPGAMKARGWVVRMGKSIAFLEGQLFDATDQLIATASSTARMVPMDFRAAQPKA